MNDNKGTMSHPMLKSIQPLNILSFGPDTEPLELRRLNVLIGANGSGKSNFIEVVRLLNFLPEKEPWNVILSTGGVSEWIWKASKSKISTCSLRTELSLGERQPALLGSPRDNIALSLDLEKSQASLRVKGESISVSGPDGRSLWSSFERHGTQGTIRLRGARAHEPSASFDLVPERSILSQLASPTVQASGIGADLPEIFEIAEFFDNFDFHQDWEFGVDSPAREPQTVGQSVDRLEENGYNLAQLLAHYRDNHKGVFERVTDLTKQFYEPVRSVEIRLISTHLQIAVEEAGGFSTPASRLSDGMLRWLAMLAVLLNPSPAPVTCIDEPELGLHPDVIPTLADLLRDASARTQLIVTTHSPALVDAFSDEPESICVSEKVGGSSAIRRLSGQDLNVWLEKYSLGKLWTSGEIGGNRW